MAVEKLSAYHFIQQACYFPVFDVRSPSEYDHAHVPGAFSLPIFTDEERKIIGTAYKQQSREKAIKHGLEFFGPKMVKMVEEVEKISARHEAGVSSHESIVRSRVAGVSRQESGVRSLESSVRSTESGREPGIDSGLKTKDYVLVHCWRGGMRSSAVGWLLDLYGFKVYLLDGGYKAFRQWVSQQFEKDYPLNIIGGYTGSGKTEILTELKRKGETVIDLEALANHKGSAFGGIGQRAQPSTEMFENKLAVELFRAEAVDKWQMTDDSEQEVDRCKMTDEIDQEVARCQMTDDRGYKEQSSQKQPVTIWIEDESQRIGNINIPNEFWKSMRSKPVLFLDIPFEARLENILQYYGKGDMEKLINGILRIKKRLGGLETKAAINFLTEDNLKECFRILLNYYDKYYKKGLHSREGWENLVTKIQTGKADPFLNASSILSIKKKEQNV